MKIQTENSFPTSAGLASSASGACALVMAFVRLVNFFNENEQEIKEDILINIKKWINELNEEKIVKILCLGFLLRNLSGSSMRSMFLEPSFIKTFDWNLSTNENFEKLNL